MQKILNLWVRLKNILTTFITSKINRFTPYSHHISFKKYSIFLKIFCDNLFNALSATKPFPFLRCATNTCCLVEPLESRYPFTLVNMAVNTICVLIPIETQLFAGGVTFILQHWTCYLIRSCKYRVAPRLTTNGNECILQCFRIRQERFSLYIYYSTQRITNFKSMWYGYK